MKKLTLWVLKAAEGLLSAHLQQFKRFVYLFHTKQCLYMNRFSPSNDDGFAVIFTNSYYDVVFYIVSSDSERPPSHNLSIFYLLYI